MYLCINMHVMKQPSSSLVQSNEKRPHKLDLNKLEKPYLVINTVKPLL